jgi:hypothetical protein
MHETRNDLAEGTEAVVKLLNERLAEAIDLQLQAKQLIGRSRARTSLDSTIFSIALQLRPLSTSI